MALHSHGIIVHLDGGLLIGRHLANRGLAPLSVPGEVQRKCWNCCLIDPDLNPDYEVKNFLGGPKNR